ncbi:uncharacterized protein DSM5745_09757 [Aspergillus mulundensis]|uniref:Protein kinase domain-containing protein n=1 Tax=Aspergillus mulundensis TaxID=1810919 RepID=A0A3D8QR96_9EURO|nr:hypothetical protein DSM5745_09757 [Aspergillus mulundensis]RDW64346.1 hypothetical protein DSM5745_09757 [Aspergillus mulundensis]
MSSRHKNVLIDTITYPPETDLNLASIHVRDLARRLSNSDPFEFGLLPCRGVVKSREGDDTKFNLVFDIPRSLSNPRTLRQILLQKAPHALNDRFQLARQLVRSLMFVHTSGFVHKSIRPDTIVVFETQDSPFGPSFLIGFERFRPGDAGTFLTGDSSWEKNLYATRSGKGYTLRTDT